MKRGRDWRRYKEKCIVIKRLKRKHKCIYWFKDANKIRIRNPHWYDWIGTKNHYLLKSKGGSEKRSYKFSPKWRNSKCDWFGKKSNCRNFHKKITTDLINEYIHNKNII